MEDKNQIKKRINFQHLAIRPETFLLFRSLKNHPKETDDMLLNRILKQFQEQMS